MRAIAGATASLEAGRWPEVAAGRMRDLLTAEMAEALTPLLDDISAEMANEIERCVPEYARSHDSAYARMVLKSSSEAVRDFVAGVKEDGPTGQPVTDLFRRIGQGEAHSDRSLDALQIAMHVGTEVIWRRLSQACARLGMTEEKLGRLGEALLFHFRENVRAAADGYMAAQTKLNGEAQRRRLRLLDLLVSDPPVSIDAIGRMAVSAGWPLPNAIAVVALSDHSAFHINAQDLPSEVLADFNRSEPALVVPDPDRDSRVKAVARAVRGCLAALGPPVPPADGATSLRWAREALALAHRGVIDGTDLVDCTEHLSTLVLFQNEELIQTMATVRLAPLAHLRPDQRDRLAETLLHWLRAGGDASKVAATLFVHPQTVRYRIRQLQDLFGAGLRDPDVRLELELVLRARSLLREESATGSARPPPSVHHGHGA